MTRSHGRCARGERLRMGFPHGHRKTTALVAGLRMTGMVAPMVLDGPINGDWFEAYVTQILAPELRPGDVVIMDNLSSHKRDAVRERIEAVGATLRSATWSSWTIYRATSVTRCVNGSKRSAQPCAPRPKAERLFAPPLLRKLLPTCPAFLAARITSPTKLSGRRAR
ncbi:MAG: hypothetical protein B7Z58_17805 [Acidiphilium sp. 37-64-53]|nr:MAG: hypothetical protein B7Z58_17805 [Acidiphilium sp. 37-64-53]